MTNILVFAPGFYMLPASDIQCFIRTNPSTMAAIVSKVIPMQEFEILDDEIIAEEKHTWQRVAMYAGDGDGNISIRSGWINTKKLKAFPVNSYGEVKN